MSDQKPQLNSSNHTIIYMSDIRVGFIYKIVSPYTDKCYIGKTKQSLAKRFRDHLTDYEEGLKKCYIENRCASRIIIHIGDPRIILIETVNIDNMKMKEIEWIGKSNCVNIQYTKKDQPDIYNSQEPYDKLSLIMKQTFYPKCWN